MRIALVGISGRIGRHLAREALARGHQVLGLVREGATAADLPAPTRGVDLFDAAGLAKVVRGHDALVSAYGAPADAPQLLAAATACIVEAARATGIERVLTVGGAGGLEVRPGVRLADTPEFPAALLPKVKAHGDAVSVLAGSGLDWTCIAPAAQIGPGERTGRYRLAVGALVTDPSGRSSISYEDFACAVLDELEVARHPRQVLGTGY